MEKNIHGNGKELLNDFALQDGFHDFNYLRTITQSIDAIHGTYAQGVEYSVERYLNDVRDMVDEEVDSLPISENEAFIMARNSLNKIKDYIGNLISYPSDKKKDEKI